MIKALATEAGMGSLCLGLDHPCVSIPCNHQAWAAGPQNWMTSHKILAFPSEVFRGCRRAPSPKHTGLQKLHGDSLGSGSVCPGFGISGEMQVAKSQNRTDEPSPVILHRHARASNPRKHSVPAPRVLRPLKQQVRSNGTWCPLHLTPSVPGAHHMDIAEGTLVTQ